MAASPRSLPFSVEKVYGTDPLKPESQLLDNEQDGGLPAGRVRVRLLTDFLFVKANQFVYPNFDLCSEEFWEDVEVWGFMMSPSGSGKWYAWSLLWHLDWRDKHVELVKIPKVTGMSKEKNTLYRDGKQVALWLDSPAGFAYALMEPEETIADRWALVCDSWRKVGKEQLPVPVCRAVTSLTAPPRWWDSRKDTVAGRLWKQLVRNETEHRKQFNGDEDKDQDQDKESVESEQPEFPQPKQTASTTKEKHRESAVGKRKRGNDEQALHGPDSGEATSKTTRANEGSVSAGTSPMTLPAKMAALGTPADADPSSGSDMSVSEGDHLSPPPSSPKRTRTMTTLEQALSAEDLLLRNPGAQYQPQCEPASSHNPGPNTPPAMISAPSSPNGNSTCSVFADDKDNSPTTKQYSPAFTQVANQGSQVTQQISGLSIEADGNEELVGMAAKGRIASIEIDPAILQDWASSSAHGAVQPSNFDVDHTGFSMSTVPDTTSTSPMAPTTGGKAPAPSALSTIPTAKLPASLRQVLLPPSAQAPVAGTLAPPVSNSETGHLAVAVPDSAESAASSLENRSSRRHRRRSPL